MHSMLNGDRYKLLKILQYLQEQDENKENKFIMYKAALAYENGKATFTVADKTYQTSDYFGDQNQKASNVIDDFEKKSSMTELNSINEKKKKKKKVSKKDKDVGKRSKLQGADDDESITKMDFLPTSVLKSIAKKRNLDEFVDQLDERKKRRKRRKKKRKSRKKKPTPNKYQRSKYKARSGTRRGDTMARLSDKIKRGKKLTKADYKARDDSEAAERKKKGFKSKPRFDTGMYLSEAKKLELDAFVEMLEERKKRRKKRRKSTRKKRKSTKKKKKSSAGKLSAKTKETLKKKAKKRGLTPGSVYAEYRKGLAAYYSSGSRKGMSAHQWAHARVNSANPSKSWAVVKKAKGGKKK